MVEGAVGVDGGFVGDAGWFWSQHFSLESEDMSQEAGEVSGPET